MLQGIERERPSGRWRSKYDLYTQGSASKSIMAMQWVESEIYFAHYWIISLLISSNMQLFSILFQYTEVCWNYRISNTTIASFQIYFFLPGTCSGERKLLFDEYYFLCTKFLFDKLLLMICETIMQWSSDKYGKHMPLLTLHLCVVE